MDKRGQSQKDGKETKLAPGSFCAWSSLYLSSSYMWDKCLCCLKQVFCFLYSQLWTPVLSFVGGLSWHLPGLRYLSPDRIGSSGLGQPVSGGNSALCVSLGFPTLPFLLYWLHYTRTFHRPVTNLTFLEPTNVVSICFCPSRLHSSSPATPSLPRPSSLWPPFITPEFIAWQPSPIPCPRQFELILPVRFHEILNQRLS